MKSLYLIVLLILPVSWVFGQVSVNEYYNNKTDNVPGSKETLGKRCVTAGDKLYAIGLQDGDFPDMGDHLKDEMGGIWMHPIKLLDGFWLKIEEMKEKDGIVGPNGQGGWLEHADQYITFPYGNEFIYHDPLPGLEVSRFQFVPVRTRGLKVSYTIKNNTDKKRELALRFYIKPDLLPVWYSEKSGIKDGTDSVWYDKQTACTVARDLKNPWFVYAGTDRKDGIWTKSIPGDIHQKNDRNDTGCQYIFNLSIAAGKEEKVNLYIAGSEHSGDEAKQVYEALKSGGSGLLASKIKRYQEISQRSDIEIPDQHLQEVYKWVKYNTDWLIRDVDGIGRGLGAGFPEYPWWFGTDNSYSLQAVLAMGNFDLVKSTLRLLKSLSEKENGNGRVIHEANTFGDVYNPGNTQETAHFIMAVWKTFEWTGDREFLKEFYPFVKKGINWLTKDMDSNNDLFPEGFGIMEVRGLSAELIDVAVYTQQALASASAMAGIVNEKREKEYYSALSEKIKTKINTEFWDEKSDLYCDFYGSSKQALAAWKGNMEQYKDVMTDATKKEFQSEFEYFSSFPENYMHGWSTNRNWVINTPMETGIAPPEKAIPALQKMGGSDFCGEYGPYLSQVVGIYQMTIATGVQAMAECSYNRTDEAMRYVQMIAGTFSKEMPGSINEMMPDYGCFVQAWTSYGIMLPLITHIFGFHPSAYEKKMVITPYLPSGWENMKLNKLSAGDNNISFSRERKGSTVIYKIVSEKPGWNLEFNVPELKFHTIQVNGKEFDLVRNPSERAKLTLTASETTVTINL